MKLCSENTLYRSVTGALTEPHLEKRAGGRDASFHLFLMSGVGHRGGERLSGASESETNRNQEPVLQRAPRGLIHFLLTFPFFPAHCGGGVQRATVAKCC